MRIFLSIVVGAAFSGLALGVVFYLSILYIPGSGGGGFISVDRPEYLAGAIGAVIGCILGMAAALLLSALGVVGIKAVVLSVLANAVGWVFLFFWTEGGILEEPSSTLLILAMLAIGAINGFLISFINAGRNPFSV